MSEGSTAGNPGSGLSHDNEQSYPSTSDTAPPTFDDIDRWQYHIGLQEFGEGLEAAARAVFPNYTKSRYTNVFVLMLCWEDENPQLPVSIEIQKLLEVFRDTYNYATEIWKIPDQSCHSTLNKKILDFTEISGDSKEHLKIVYYAGHARLTKNRLLTWTRSVWLLKLSTNFVFLSISSWRCNEQSKYPTVKWSGIQNVLEEAQSDVLILLDCCAAGALNTLEGNGVTELLSACGYNASANGVGQYSFTNALILELTSLSTGPPFTVAYLYNNIFSRIQGRMPEDGTERHPPPIHLILTQESKYPQSIQLSKLPNTTHEVESTKSSMVRGKRPEGGGVTFSTPIVDAEVQDDRSDSYFQSSCHSFPTTKVPRMAFAVRLKDDLKPKQLRIDLFVEWLRSIPAVAEEVKVEAGFESFSSLIILSIPLALSTFLPSNRAIVSLGPITSSNQLLSQKSVWRKPQVIHSRSNPNSRTDDSDSFLIVPNQNSRRGRDGRPGPVYQFGPPPQLLPDPQGDVPISKGFKSVLSQLPEESKAPATSSKVRVQKPANTSKSSLRKVFSRRQNKPADELTSGGRWRTAVLPTPPSSQERSPS
jgi:hypothetical protein